MVEKMLLRKPGVAKAQNMERPMVVGRLTSMVLGPVALLGSS